MGEETQQNAQNTASEVNTNTTGDAQSLTFGQKAVGLSFNPGKNPKVEEIKQAFAKVIDILNDMRPEYNGKPNEVSRMLAIAITDSQTAQMWAVKAATWQD